MAWSVVIARKIITLNHNGLPFIPPENVIVKNYTTLNYDYLFKSSGLGSINKRFTRYSELRNVVDTPTRWNRVLFTDNIVSTSSSGSAPRSGSVFFGDSTMAPQNEGFDALEAGDEIELYATMTVKDKADGNPRVDVEDTSAPYKIAEWAPPKIYGAMAYRANEFGTPDDVGTKIRYSFSAEVFPLTGYGHAEFFMRYKRPTDTLWTEIQLLNGENEISIADVELDGDFPLNESYIFQFVAYDGYVSMYYQALVFTGFTTMHFNKEKTGMAIGKYCEGPGFDVGWDARFRGNVQFDNAPSYLTPVAAREALGIYTGRSVFTDVGSKTQYITVPFGKTLPSVPSAVIASIGVSGSMTSTYQTVDTTYAYTDHDFRIKCNNGSSLNTVWVDWIAIL